jgi:hypothetical protein
MICGDISSVGGQSSSTDESDSTMSLQANVRIKSEPDGVLTLRGCKD